MEVEVEIWGQSSRTTIMSHATCSDTHSVVTTVSTSTGSVASDLVSSIGPILPGLQTKFVLGFEFTELARFKV
jgi:hypothetical protein